MFHAVYIPTEGFAWMQLLHRNADVLLLLSIGVLGLLPLVSIYLIETDKIEAVETMDVSSVTRTVLRSLIYLAILFPYLLALLSTYISVQLIRHPGFPQEQDQAVILNRSWAKAASFWKFYPNTKVLQEKDMDLNHTWKIPSSDGESSSSRLVEGECVICMHEYQVGEKIVWASNPHCIHCYHKECLQAWMEPWDDKSKRCPCCRQAFFK